MPRYPKKKQHDEFVEHFMAIKKMLVEMRKTSLYCNYGKIPPEDIMYSYLATDDEKAERWKDFGRK